MRTYLAKFSQSLIVACRRRRRRRRRLFLSRKRERETDLLNRLIHNGSTTSIITFLHECRAEVRFLYSLLAKGYLNEVG